MNLNRIWAMILRYTYNTRHSFDRLADVFYWPALDLFIWGMTGLYIAKLTNNSSEYLFVILSGLVFWIIVWRAQYEITVNLLLELWDRNIVNIFSSPLTIPEWISSFMIFGLIKTFISVTFSAILTYFVYDYNILRFGFNLFLFALGLLLTGWAGGFFIAGYLIRYGQKIQILAWAGIALLAPFSAVYYPLSILPEWAQKIGLIIPSTYIFEGIRQSLFTGTISYAKILIGLTLGFVYLALSIWFFISMFKKSRKLGLGRLI
jgi:ABC-2 type transport system permease protein